MIRDDHYREKQVHRARGIDDLERRVGAVCAEIDRRLRMQEVVRVLELGCGYGTAMLELVARYGARVNVCGLNRAPEDGNAEVLFRNGRDRGLIAAGVTADVGLPTMAYGDVATGLPFADGSFDVVYSQVAWLYFGNKIGVIREVIRTLADGGVAKIDADELLPGLPPEYARLVEIWDRGHLLPFADYLRRFGMGLVPASEGEYLRVAKVDGFGADLTAIVEIDLRLIHAHWDGIKCVYSCAGEIP